MSAWTASGCCPWLLGVRVPSDPAPRPLDGHTAGQGASSELPSVVVPGASLLSGRAQRQASFVARGGSLVRWLYPWSVS